MAKKSKKSILASVMENELSVNSSNPTNFANNDQSSEQIQIKEEIQYDDICNINTELIKISTENSELKDKIAEYIDNIEKLQKEYKNLKDDYDNVLIKLSDLTFENALLKSKIDELEKSQNLNVNSNNNLTPLKIKQSINVPYINTTKCHNNGYNDWN